MRFGVTFFNEFNYTLSLCCLFFIPQRSTRPRDTKNNKLGIGLECANSRSVERFDNLLLIAALILYLLWCIGCTAVIKKIHYSLQANTQKARMVLSIITIAREIINDHRYSIPLEEYVYVLSQLSNLTVNIEGLHE